MSMGHFEICILKLIKHLIYCKLIDQYWIQILHSLYFYGVEYRWAELILQPFRRFTYVTTHFPTLRSLYLRHSSFSNPSVASPTSQFNLLPFFRFPYVTSSSPNSPGEPPMFIIRVFCPRARLSLQTQEPRLQFCPKTGLPLQTSEPRL